MCYVTFAEGAKGELKLASMSGNMQHLYCKLAMHCILKLNTDETPNFTVFIVSMTDFLAGSLL